MATTLSRDAARAFYDRLGSRQDRQGWYEDPATRLLIDHADLATARSAVELGCGTGRFAEELLAEHLPEAARYLGIDQSATMVRLSRQRLERFGERAQVVESDGSLELAALSKPTATAPDRFVANYVFDLLSEADIATALTAAHRALAPGGLLCVTGLTRGPGLLSGAVSRLLKLVHRLNPALLGGCRPLDMVELLARSPGGDVWEVRHHSKVTPYGIASEVVVAAKR